MTNGRLKLTFDSGEIVRASASAGLDALYEGLFNTAFAELQQDSDAKIDAGIQLVIFGCFWMESLCNETLRSLLGNSIEPYAPANALWKVVKKAPLPAKFSILSTFADPPNPEYVKSLTTEQGVFDLRNRLGHFKDEETPVHLPRDVGKSEADFESHFLLCPM